jgi:hypothetical protein
LDFINKEDFGVLCEYLADVMVVIVFIILRINLFYIFVLFVKNDNI